MKTVLFACVHNAGRSQMAAALFNRLAHPERARAISAGTQPGPAVHPEVLTVLREVGVELAAATPQLLTPELAAQAHLLVTLGCGEACPVVPGVRREGWAAEVVQGARALHAPGEDGHPGPTNQGAEGISSSPFAALHMPGLGAQAQRTPWSTSSLPPTVTG